MHINNLDNCYGCHACKYICPKNAIVMNYNDEGFLYPTINENKCVNCGMCLRVCPKDKTEVNIENFNQTFYWAKDKKIESRLKSQSGGVAALLTEYILNKGGVSYCCVVNSDFKVEHIRIISKLDINMTRGSKYVQSDISTIYDSLESDICNLNGKPILIVGTPCQISGIKSWMNQLNISYHNLYFIDLICHGVGSPIMWRDYIDYIKAKKRIETVNFRDKGFGWSSHTESYTYRKNKFFSKGFTSILHTDLAFRKSCGLCKYANYVRVSDLTIGDFWGYKNIGIAYDPYGISEVIINTDKGNEIFNEIKNSLIFKSITKEQGVQHNLLKPTEVDNSKRNTLFEVYKKEGFQGVKIRYSKDFTKLEYLKKKIQYIYKAFKRVLMK